MWLVTTRGFYSAVKHRHVPDALMIRARSKADLERLCELDGLQHYAEDITSVYPADYPWRIPIMSRADWTNAMAAMTEEVDYDNFKNAVKAKMPNGAERASTYMRFWSAGLKIEREESAQVPRRWEPEDDWHDQGGLWPDEEWPEDEDEDGPLEVLA